MKPGDSIAAGAPVIATLTLSQINQLVGIIGGLLGIIYLLWRWRRESKKYDEAQR